MLPEAALTSLLLAPSPGKLVTNQPHDEEVDLDSEGSIEYENGDVRPAGREDSHSDMGCATRILLL